MRIPYIFVLILGLGYVHTESDPIKLALEACQVESFCSGNVSAQTGPELRCCGPCSCDRSCVRYRNCCPDADIDIKSFPEHPYERFSTCEHSTLSQPVSMGLYGDTLHLTMVSKCIDGSSCRPINLNLSTAKISTYVAVSDRKTGTIFINRKCAFCHGVKDVAEWTIEVDQCVEKAEFVLDIMFSEEEPLSYVYAMCRIIMMPPLDYQRISERSICRNRYHKCNMSKQWEKYNAVQDYACSSGIYEIMNLKRKGSVQRNPFCLHCNEAQSFINNQMRDLCDVGAMDTKAVFSKYSRIFGLLENDVHEKKTGDRTCNASHALNTIQNSCRRLYCPPMYRPYRGQCQPIPISLQQYRFIVYVKFSYTRRKNMHWNESSTTHTSFSELLIQRTLQLLTIRRECLLMAYIMSYNSSKTKQSGFYVASEILTMVPACFFTRVKREINRLYQTEVQVVISKVHFNAVVIDVPTLLSDSIFLSSVREHIKSRIIHVESVKIDYTITFIGRNYHSKYLGIPLIKVNGPYSCAYFILNRTEMCSLQAESSCNTSNTVYKNNISVIYVFTEKGNITIQYRACYHKFNELRQPSLLSSVAAEGIISFTLSVISLICIVPTVVVMIQNKKVDPSSRKLFLSSVINLFIAQATFQFGTGWVDSPLICKFSGIILHYAWLATIFSFNSFSLLICRQLWSTTVDFKVNKSVAVLLAYTYVTPSVLVFVNIGYRLATTKGLTIGYSDSNLHCNIDLPIMRALLFALPIVMVVMCNVFVFFGVVYKIRSMSVRTSPRGFSNALVYFRLLLFTGISWLIGFINEFVQSEVLAIMFSIAVGGQGIGFCLAFVVQFKHDENSN